MSKHFVGIASACILLIVGSLSASAQSSALLDQNWSSKDRKIWYERSQGSRLIPLSWILSLEEIGSTGPLLSPANVDRWRYVLRRSSEGYDLPLGFAVDRSDDDEYQQTKLRWKDGQDSDEPWLGLNCSACHTNEIAYSGKRIRVEGAPTLADFETFLRDLGAAVKATLADPERFERFATRVIGPEITAGEKARLKDAATLWSQRFEALQALNAPILEPGYGRLDAFGHIFNKVSFVSGAPVPTGNPSDAPVSYPFLWNVPQHEAVQWNGIAEKREVAGYDIGALGRNAGEVIGVFADVDSRRETYLKGYTSSVDVEGLSRLEKQLRRLKPPAWPASLFGALDPALVSRGRTVYREQGCQTCHQLLSRDDLETRIPLKRSPLKEAGTDIWMACNAFANRAASGNLESVPVGYLDPIFAARLQKVDGSAAQLETLVAGVLVNKKRDILAEIGKELLDIQAAPEPGVMLFEALGPEARRRQEKARKRALCETSDAAMLGYKARPLNGIWATAPFLHNGSVPTLHDLLLPPDQRPKRFFVGSREFDPEKVGFVTAPGPTNGFEFRVVDDGGTPIEGNSNLGHDYGNAGLGEADRRALIEYLKSL